MEKKYISSVHNNQIRGYKSQIAQHNKKIEFYKEKVLFLEKTSRESEELKKLKEQNTQYFAQMVEYKSQLQKVKDSLGVQEAFTTTERQEDDLLMQDPSMHNHFLDFLYVGNMAVHQIGSIIHLKKELRDTHQSMGNFMLFIMRRYEKLRGVENRIKEFAL